MVTVKDLPDEIVIEIFGFLSPKTLKNCNLVCKRYEKVFNFKILGKTKFSYGFTDGIK